ncbi:MAG TPA: universal stress protein [Dehalococcoidia bacterium]|nr:universal stress protein [Dehalococcoidia bacterium]
MKKVGIKRLLVPLDGSARSDAALPITAALARELEAEVVLVHVTEAPETRALESDAKKASQDLFERAGKQLPGAVRMRVEELGDPVKGILHAVAEEAPDLVVMATRGQFGLTEVTKGSVTSDIIKSGLAPFTVVYAPDQGA